MNKQELTIVILLFVLLLGWGYFHRTRLAPASKQTEPASVEEVREDGKITDAFAKTSPARATPEPATARREPVLAAGPSEPPETEGEGRLLPEKTVVLSNDKADVIISSWGGAIVSVELKSYRATVDKDSNPVCLNFSCKPALSFIGIPGLSTNNDFKVSLSRTGESVRIERTTALGLRLERTIALGEDYVLKITDVFSNGGTGQMAVPAHGLGIGQMRMIETKARTRGISYLGLDTLASAGGHDVVHWAKAGSRNDPVPLAGRFQPPNRRGRGCAMMKPKLIEPLPRAVEIQKTIDTEWVGVKNKFFVQILAPKGGGNGFMLNAKRVVPETENPDDSRTLVQAASIEEVSADMRFREQVLLPGAVLTREVSYYVGPKKYSILKQLGNHQDEVMFRTWSGWGWFRSLCVALLWTLNAVYKVIPNYGIAIILLTVIVKIIFWPITHKSTESMKKMQKIQPLVTKLREKYKDKPQKMNQEVMALYKEHKVNPMMGCLPMVVQIPVFIALFTVLRSAVELRFADFLWIRDLSEPEGLLAGILPIPLNILPILMTVTMIWQQRLTPTGGDPQQQKMMQWMMPGMMLLFLYNMASALILYWTVSQCLSIAQLLWQRRKKVDPGFAEGYAEARSSK